MPPLVIAALGVLGAAALVKVIASESRRVNEALARRRAAEDAPEAPVTRLERDPETGAYRPRQD
ncbi:hypothetical protein [Xanthobacter pseudotagetidis]|uniref:hypothetical protein n=1 Tax=Xanthobacter pseudotagetidis TaxID=3119911 RepID=UPI00372AD29A